MYIIGGLEDQTILYVWSRLSSIPFSLTNEGFESFFVYKDIFKVLINPFISNQPLLWLIYSVLGSIFNENIINVLSVATLIITFYFSYKYFKKYSHSIVFSLLFTASTYSLTHIGRHVALSQIWLIPLFFMSLETSKRYKHFYIAGTISLSFLISTYLGFLLSLTYACLTFIYMIINLFRKEDIKSAVTQFIIVTFLSILIISPILYPYLKTVFLNPDSSERNFRLPKRTMSDFASFSSRPWYFFIPPTKNPILGKFSENIVNRIAETNYFLADDYFPKEHQANYFGLLFLTSVLITSFIYIKKDKDRYISENILYLLTLVILISFMMPPFFTISGIKFYTPNWIIFKLFPMFRVMSRLGVIVHFILLIMLSKMLVYLKQITKKVKLVDTFIICLFIITIVETFIPFNIHKIKDVPEVYSYFNKEFDSKNVIAVYPYSKTREGFFWLPEHKQLLLNPRGYRNNKFIAEDLTNLIPSDEGINNLKIYETKYLVVFKEGDAPEYFKNTERLLLEKEFSNSYLYKIL